MALEEVVAPVMASTDRDWLSTTRGINSSCALANHSPVALSLSSVTWMSVILPPSKVTSQVIWQSRPKLGAVPL